MTLDDFLRALENLIEDREASDDDPGEGNFSCEDCRACNHCRFCVGCDSCEDCTYCEECIDCVGATQSKRCVGCRKISYCDDSRDCTNSRYLTLCVACTDCVHCLACVGIAGGEFYVLNEKRTRKEYFALLRQVQELMHDKMNGGWRPPGIGLASEIFDAVAAGRDSELTAAPWLGDSLEPPRDDYRDAAPNAMDHELGYEPGYGREPGRDQAREDWGEPRGARREAAREHHERGPAQDSGEDPRGGRGVRYPREPSEGDWIREPPPEYGTSYSDSDSDAGRRGRPRERGRPRPGQDYGRDLSQDDYAQDHDAPQIRGSDVYRPMPDYGYGGHDGHHGHDGHGGHGGHDHHDVPNTRDQQPTEPFARGQREPVYDPARGGVGPRPRDPSAAPGGAPDYGEVQSERVWEDSRDSTVARAGRHDPGNRDRSTPEHDLIGLELPPLPELPELPEPPPAREREPSSPWLDDNAAQARRRAKKGSLRRAGRPQRPPEAPGRREITGTGTGTGSASARVGSEGTHTGSALRLGRKPKRKRSSS
ncbi:hypothetical protein ENSA5_21250 [Enhygromyxa salina]|uniref:Epidermal growth factor receptor n=1 Tax=Enhygromyxa salina TaxID=215803 RepID=A0A2S9YCJ7_9BACT|nr:hypothetical protein [Enhygromyxa salina]PRQ02772.1 hypothetical protein ENSA5_21250 [Enhygromyxa salina]